MKRRYSQGSAVQGRELGSTPPRNFARSVGADVELVRRLERARTLQFHEGCVNTVSFTSSGELLLSGSDDRRIALWSADLWSKNANASTTATTPRLHYDSGHAGNVFQARSMPCSSDRTVVSCAADGGVRVGFIPQGGGKVETKELYRHRGRAHKLALEPGSPYCFFTCGEDGVLCALDLREAGSDGAAQQLAKCVSLNAKKRTIGLNTVVVNPANPQLLAVGGSDEYARLYDRRKMCNSASSSRTAEVVRAYAPQHLAKRENKRKGADYYITCLAYSVHGELLASYNDELIYLFEPEGAPHHDMPAFDASAEDADFGRVVRHYEGHRNAETVKGVAFFGPNSEYVVSGSDCGHIFIWNKTTSSLVQMLKGDSHVVNCLEPHPGAMVLATSGIEDDIKIWTPTAPQPNPLPENAQEIIRQNREHRERRPHAIEISPEVLMHLMRLHQRATGRDSEDELGNDGDDSDESDDRRVECNLQ
eukprot:jgi/Chlat1/9297/Chrsp99S08502